MTIITTRSHVILITSDDSVEYQLVILSLVLMLEDHEVSPSSVVQVGDVVVGAAEQHLQYISQFSSCYSTTSTDLFFVLG